MFEVAYYLTYIYINILSYSNCWCYFGDRYKLTHLSKPWLIAVPSNHLFPIFVSLRFTFVVWPVKAPWSHQLNTKQMIVL
jgi:hypothetical protein